jgi:hypothetical protein
VRHHTGGVHVAVGREVHLALDGTAVQDLLHDCLLGGSSVATADKFDVGNLSDRFALSEVAAR